MGTLIKGICKDCGYETAELSYGGGFINFTTCCEYPVFDTVVNVVKTANIMDRVEVIRKNPHLIFYDNEKLINMDFQNKSYFHEWDEYKLYGDGYFCPKCNSFRLGFESIGCFD